MHSRCTRGALAAVRPACPLKVLPYVGLVAYGVVLHVLGHAGHGAHLLGELAEEGHRELLVGVDVPRQHRIGGGRRVGITHLEELLHRHLHLA